MKENEEDVLSEAPGAAEDLLPEIEVGVDVADIEIDIQRLLDDLEIDLAPRSEPAFE